jgi:hypothetical protein
MRGTQSAPAGPLETEVRKMKYMILSNLSLLFVILAFLGKTVWGKTVW